MEFLYGSVGIGNVYVLLFLFLRLPCFGENIIHKVIV